MKRTATMHRKHNHEYGTMTVPIALDVLFGLVTIFSVLAECLQNTLWEAQDLFLYRKDDQCKRITIKRGNGQNRMSYLLRRLPGY